VAKLSKEKAALQSELSSLQKRFDEMNAAFTRFHKNVLQITENTKPIADANRFWELMLYTAVFAAILGLILMYWLSATAAKRREDTLMVKIRELQMEVERLGATAKEKEIETDLLRVMAPPKVVPLRSADDVYVVELEEGGEKATFVVDTLRCEPCGEKGILPKNARRHVSRAHKVRFDQNFAMI
jgi:hypothetical protein